MFSCAGVAAKMIMFVFLAHCCSHIFRFQHGFPISVRNMWWSKQFELTSQITWDRWHGGGGRPEPPMLERYTNLHTRFQISNQRWFRSSSRICTLLHRYSLFFTNATKRVHATCMNQNVSFKQCTTEIVWHKTGVCMTRTNSKNNRLQHQSIHNDNLSQFIHAYMTLFQETHLYRGHDRAIQCCLDTHTRLCGQPVPKSRALHPMDMPDSAMPL